MPSLLSRYQFHQHNHHHQHNQQNELDTDHSGDDEAERTSTPSPPGLIKSPRSFLNFINRGPSHDSLRSGGSTDSLHGHTPHSTVSPHGSFIDSLSPASSKHSHSMAELKRFFRSPMAKKSPLHQTSPTHSRRQRQQDAAGTPPPPAMHMTSTQQQQQQQQHHHHHHHHHHEAHTQSAIPPTSDSSLSLSNRINIYHDDSILAQKYGKLGKLLGSGAGGSVKILTRPSDNATFAVKEFRPRKPNESVKDYAKKCTAEYLIGSTLHHPNIIETVDIFSDSRQNKYYEVMQYCPIDFFAVVMTGKMSRGEINCCLKQMANGVQYLHSKGLAHRDLKLDNCVMTEHGILKLIDFGSAVVFKYPFEDTITMAHGIVGSDPYLAPEVLTSTRQYDPQLVDVWSIAIIYCCMMLKRFPWKAPNPENDENFRLFCMPDEVPHDYEESAKHHEMLLRERQKQRMPQRQQSLKPIQQDHIEAPPPHSNIANEKSHNLKSVASTKTQVSTATNNNNNSSSSNNATPHTRKMIHGPYRLLRLLPHASRPIISKMLQVDVTKRATLDQLYQDTWFNDIPCCTMRNNKVVRSQGHHHTIVKEEDGHTVTYKI